MNTPTTSNFSFEEITIDSSSTTSPSKKRYSPSDVNPDCILSCSNPGVQNNILFVLETPLETSKDVEDVEAVEILKNCLNFLFKGHVLNWQVISATPLKVSLDDIRRHTIYQFYKQNKTDITKYIIPGRTVIVPFGIALSSIIESDDLSYECFQDSIFNKTYFYSSLYQSYVFPVAPLSELILKPSIKDSFHVEFFNLQCRFISTNQGEIFKKVDTPTLNTIKLKTKEDWYSFFHENNSQKLPVAYDIETSGLSFNQDKIGCISMSFDGLTGYYIPWSIIDKQQLSEFFKDRYQIGHNLKFDAKFLIHNGIENITISSDTLQLGHHLNEMRFNGLKSLVYHYTPYGGYNSKLEDYIKLYNPNNYLDIDESILSQYAAMDAMITYQIHCKMQQQLTELDEKFPPSRGEASLRYYYEQVKIPASNNFLKIEYDGFYVNMEKWDEGALKIENEIISIEDQLRKKLGVSTSFIEIEKDNYFSFGEESAVGDDHTLQSGKKLGKILEDLGWECLGKSKGGWFLTGDEQLKLWAKTHPEASLIQKLRSLLTLQKTFLGKISDSSLGWRKYVVQDKDGRYKIHCSYKSMLMASHRNGCSNPNYQQIPSSSLGAEYFKKIISVPDDKYFLVTLDYSSFQLRLAAVDSNDPVLVPSYNDNPNADIHTKTAYNVFVKGTKFEIEEIELRDGDKVIKCFPHEDVSIIRNGKELRIKASDVLETDSLE